MDFECSAWQVVPSYGSPVVLEPEVETDSDVGVVFESMHFDDIAVHFVSDWNFEGGLRDWLVFAEHCHYPASHWQPCYLSEVPHMPAVAAY